MTCGLGRLHSFDDLSRELVEAGSVLETVGCVCEVLSKTVLYKNVAINRSTLFFERTRVPLLSKRGIGRKN